MPAAPPEVEPLPLAGCYVLREARHADRRGHFEELFNAASWPRAGGGDDGGGVPLLPGGAPRQVSWSRSAPHTLRGMHTSPYVKLVTVVAGSCDDVLCDIRPQSPSFGRSVRLRLDEREPTQLIVGAGVAHGFVAGEVGCDMLYLQEDTFGSRGGEVDVSYKDSDLALPWPERVWAHAEGRETTLVLSDKDATAPMLRERLPREFEGATAHGAAIVPSARVGILRAQGGAALVVGASGQVGQAVREHIAREYPRTPVIGTYCKHRDEAGERAAMAAAAAAPDAGTDAPTPAVAMPSIPFDLATAGELDELSGLTRAQLLVERTRPCVVFICAAATWVDGCERQDMRAGVQATNVDGPVALAKAAHAAEARTVYFSTDYVFDGGSSAPESACAEDAPVSPLNEYGASKVRGERAVLDATGGSALVLRTAVVYGPESQGKNFVYQLCRKAASGESMAAAGDHTSSPTYSRDLAAAACELLRRADAAADAAAEGGVYNVAGPEIMSRMAFAERVSTALVRQGLMPHPATLTDVTTPELERAARDRLGFAAKRPLRVGLPIGKLEKALRGSGVRMRTVEEAVEHWAAAPRGKPLGE